jgi:putative tricarboxylic transport membrane protein
MSNLTMKKADIIAAVTVIPICLYVFYESTKWPVVALLGRPFIIPRGVAVLLLIAAGILVYRALTGRASPIEAPLVGENRRRVRLVAILTFGFLFFVERLGFFVTASLFLMLFIVVLGERRYVRVVLFALVVPLTIFTLFSGVLHVPLPRGWVEDTLRAAGLTFIFR